MPGRIGVQQVSYHALILGVVLSRLAFEELDAALAQGDGNFHALVAGNELCGWRQKIADDLNLPDRAGLVGDAFAHRFVCPCASSRRQRFG